MVALLPVPDDELAGGNPTVIHRNGGDDPAFIQVGQDRPIRRRHLTRATKARHPTQNPGQDAGAWCRLGTASHPVPTVGRPSWRTAMNVEVANGDRPALVFDPGSPVEEA